MAKSMREQLAPDTSRRATASHPPSGQSVIAAQNLTKIFKDFWRRDRARAVDGIDFEIHQGEIFGLLGPNGSGKSTTIKMILGLLKKTRGRLLVFGHAPSDVATKKRIGYLPEESYLYPFLNARETLDYYGKLFQLESRTRRHRIDELLDMVGLTAVQHRQVREYSKGMQRRIGIAQALINDPEFLILDEPTTGLDPIGTKQVKDLIVQLGQRGKTVLLSSHLLSDVEDCVDRMVILYGGRIRSEGTCEQLLEAHDRNVIETDRLDEETIREISSLLTKKNHQLEAISRPRQKLEELFVGIVEAARNEHLATSGALSGGGTAAFLRDGQSQPQPEGEQLIEDLLTSTQQVETPAGDATPVDASSTESAESSMIDELLEHTDKESAEVDAASPDADKLESRDVDQSVISQLLGGDGKAQTPRGEDSQG